MIRYRLVVTTLAVLTWTGVAQAQPLDKETDADRLFKEAQTLMEQRRFAEACPKLELAYKKDQQLGTLINLAYCHKEAGVPWISWVEFREAEAKAVEQRRDDRRDFARAKMKEIEKNLSKLVIDLRPGVELVEVDVEDRRVYDAEKGVPFAAEPGPRKMTFHAKGKKPAVLLVPVNPVKESQSKVQHIAIPELTDEAPIGALPPDNNTGPTRPTDPTTPATPEKKSSWSGQKTLAVVAGVVGLGGIAVGSVFGMKTFNSPCNRAELKPGDPAPAGRPSCSEDQRDQASTDGAFSTIGFVAGGVLLGGAVVLWITAPSRGPSAQVTVGPRWAGLSGTF